MIEVLKLLEQDARLTAGQIAAMLGKEEAAVAAYIAQCEADGILLGYNAIVNWDETDAESVTALIEVKISPQRGDGFDRIAERIYQYDEVDSLYLMSGAYDLAVMMSAPSMKDVAEFVFAKLAPMNGVSGTATHFILKKYKERDRVFYSTPEQEERVMFV